MCNILSGITDKLFDALSKGDAATFNRLRRRYPKIRVISSVLVDRPLEVRDQDLRNFRLTGMALRYIKFVNVRFLSRTSLECTRFEHCSFERCGLYGVGVRSMQLHNCKTSNCVYEEVDFIRVDVAGSIFTKDQFLACSFSQLTGVSETTWVRSWIVPS